MRSGRGCRDSGFPARLAAARGDCLPAHAVRQPGQIVAMMRRENEQGHAVGRSPTTHPQICLVPRKTGSQPCSRWPAPPFDLPEWPDRVARSPCVAYLMAMTLANRNERRIRGRNRRYGQARHAGRPWPADRLSAHFGHGPVRPALPILHGRENAVPAPARSAHAWKRSQSSLNASSRAASARSACRAASPWSGRDFGELARALGRHVAKGSLDELTLTTNGTQLSTMRRCSSMPACAASM